LPFVDFPNVFESSGTEFPYPASSIISPITFDRFPPRQSTLANRSGVIEMLIFFTVVPFGFGGRPRFFFMVVYGSAGIQNVNCEIR
jgi:hypothetical protein